MKPYIQDNNQPNSRELYGYGRFSLITEFGASESYDTREQANAGLAKWNRTSHREPFAGYDGNGYRV